MVILQVVYDITEKESFNNVKTWVKEVKSKAGENVNIILLGNKSDLTTTTKRVVSQNTAQALAHEIGAPLMEVSAKDATNVHQAFTAMATTVKQRYKFFLLFFS